MAPSPEKVDDTLEVGDIAHAQPRAASGSPAMVNTRCTSGMPRPTEAITSTRVSARERQLGECLQIDPELDVVDLDREPADDPIVDEAVHPALHGGSRQADGRTDGAVRRSAVPREVVDDAAVEAVDDTSVYVVKHATILSFDPAMHA